MIHGRPSGNHVGMSVRGLEDNHNPVKVIRTATMWTCSIDGRSSYARIGMPVPVLRRGDAMKRMHVCSWLKDDDVRDVVK